MHVAHTHTQFLFNRPVFLDLLHIEMVPKGTTFWKLSWQSLDALVVTQLTVSNHR